MHYDLGIESVQLKVDGISGGTKYHVALAASLKVIWCSILSFCPVPASDGSLGLHSRVHLLVVPLQQVLSLEDSAAQIARVRRVKVHGVNVSAVREYIKQVKPDDTFE